MTHWVRTRSPLVRALVYAALALLAFALAAGMGAMFALTLRGDVGLPERQGPRSADEQAVSRAQPVSRAQQKDGDGAAEREEAAARQDQAAANRRSADAAQRAEAEYVDAVEDIQTNAVETFRSSHDKLLRYDALVAADVRAMKDNETALQDIDDRAADLDPPPKFEEQHGVFSTAIDELREASRLAHAMAADPVAAADLGFDEYEGRVDEASSLLRRSNEMLGKDYEAIEGFREVSPEF